MGFLVLRALEGARGLCASQRRRGRVHTFFFVVLRQAVGPEPHERGQQRERRGERRPSGGVYARSQRRAPGDSGGPDEKAGDRTQSDGQRDLRDHERTVHTGGVTGLAAPYGLSLIHISEPTRLLSISYAVFCLKKKKK